MAQLTTHVLDLTHGHPGSGILVDLYRVESEGLRLIGSAFTNEDGRVNEFSEVSIDPGIYQLKYCVAKYFESLSIQQAEPEFLNEVVIQFGIAKQNEHYHVPLLLSVYGYSTYRGS